MSLLQQAANQKNDAASGESFTKGSSHIVWATVVAAIVVTVAITAYVISGQKPPAATGQILDVWVHPMHSVSAGFDANGAIVPQESIDQILVFAHVKIMNQSKERIFLHQIMTNVTLPDGIRSSYAAMPKDYERLFVAYPQMAPMHSNTISPDTTLEPGDFADGTFVCSFSMSKEDWDKRKDLSFSFAFRYLPQLTLPYTGTVTVR
jgi:hypothetical protein